MKKLIFILTLVMIFTFEYAYADINKEQELQNLPLLSYKDYQNIVPENIKALKIIRYTEDGINETDVDNAIEINQIYNFLSKIKISNESKISCTDNTTIYSFVLKDGSKPAIEIECNWIVIKGKNYNFEISN